MVAASISGWKPAIPYWPLMRTSTSTTIMTDMCRGRDMSLHSPLHCLPPNLVDALAELRMADEYLKTLTSVLPDMRSRQKVMAIQDSVQRRLLSVPTWNDLNVDVRAQASRQTYECGRLGAIMYSTAVVLALPPESGWHIRLATEIRSAVIQPRRSRNNDDDSIMLWALSLAAIACHDSWLFSWYISDLRKRARHHGVRNWSDLETILKTLVWCDSACGRGAAVLRNSLEGNGGLNTHDVPPVFSTC